MRKHIIFLVIAAVAMLALNMASEALAADQMKSWVIKEASTKIDKNGQEYVRFIVEEVRQLNGVEYTKTMPVMAFRNTVDQAKTFAAGDTLKAIVKSNDYRGNESYVILAFVK